MLGYLTPDPLSLPVLTSHLNSKSHFQLRHKDTKQLVGIITEDSNLDIIYLDYFFSRLSNYNIIRMTYEASTIFSRGNLSSSVCSTSNLVIYILNWFQRSSTKCLRKLD